MSKLSSGIERPVKTSERSVATRVAAFLVLLITLAVATGSCASHPDPKGYPLDCYGPKHSCSVGTDCCPYLTGTTGLCGADDRCTSDSCIEADAPCTDSSQCCSGSKVCTTVDGQSGKRCVCRHTGQSCTSDSECCSGGHCDNGTCGADACFGSGGEGCIDSTFCCGSLLCMPTNKFDDTLQCTCASAGQACVTDANCCNGGHCNGAECSADSCFPIGQTCDNNGAQCCGSQLCVANPQSTSDGPGANICACRVSGAGCTADAGCCEGQCTDGTCTAIACGAPGATCDAQNPCCGGVECNAGTCPTTACWAAGYPCMTDSQCCSPDSCNGGICTLRAIGSTCTDASQCISCNCTGGVCGPDSCCVAEGGSCEMSSECCNDGYCCRASGTLLSTCIADASECDI